MRVLIFTTDGPAAEAVRRALRYAASCHVLGWVDARRRYGPLGGEAAADVIVLDDVAGIPTILGRLPEIRAVHPRATVVLLASDVDTPLLAAAASARVDAVVSKSATPAAVGTLVREIAAGTVFHFQPPGEEADPAAAPEGAQPLTARELQILRLVAGGLPNSGIAAELWVTEQTVKFHLSNIYRKLGLTNRTQAAHYAHLHGLVGSPDPGSGSSIAAAAA
jgi:DNA-binding NarL/FixJ family response regulator